MGNATYSSEAYTDYSARTAHLSSEQRFTQSKVHRAHSDMDSTNVKIRESRDSEAHPHSLPIIIGLDVTGSMGYIPEELLSKDMNKLVGGMIDKHIEDPSICFTAIGDHISDKAPIQIGQFESGDQQLIHWLESTWLEGRGGGDQSESYLLAWYFAAFMTKTDNFEKRGKKGYLITIGDEATHTRLSAEDIKRIFPNSPEQESRSYTAKELYDLASEKWNIYHIHANGGNYPITQGNPRGIGNIIKESWNKIGVPMFIEDSTNSIINTIVNIVSAYDEKKINNDVDTSTESPVIL